MAPTALEGHSFFKDRHGGDDLKNRLGILVDLDRAALLVGTPGDRDVEELVLHEAAVRRALTQVVDALRRHSCRRHLIRPVWKPTPVYRDLCEGRRSCRSDVPPATQHGGAHGGRVCSCSC